MNRYATKNVTCNKCGIAATVYDEHIKPRNPCSDNEQEPHCWRCNKCHEINKVKHLEWKEYDHLPDDAIKCITKPTVIQ